MKDPARTFLLGSLSLVLYAACKGSGPILALRALTGHTTGWTHAICP
jgi:hypothetical protein